jgi:hypothetical protein
MARIHAGLFVFAAPLRQRHKNTSRRNQHKQFAVSPVKSSRLTANDKPPQGTRRSEHT